MKSVFNINFLNLCICIVQTKFTGKPGSHFRDSLHKDINIQKGKIALPGQPLYHYYLFFGIFRKIVAHNINISAPSLVENIGDDVFEKILKKLNNHKVAGTSCSLILTETFTVASLDGALKRNLSG